MHVLQEEPQSPAGLAMNRQGSSGEGRMKILDTRVQARKAGASVQEILEERARALARAPAQEEEEKEGLDLLTFRLGEECYGVDILLVQEVLPLAKESWTRIPCTPDFVVGAMNLRGRICSVLDVGRLLGLAAREPSDKAHVLMVLAEPEQQGGEPSAVGILADGLPRVRRVTAGEVKSPPESKRGRGTEYVRGFTGDLLIILDLRRLLSDPRIIVDEEP